MGATDAEDAEGGRRDFVSRRRLDMPVTPSSSSFWSPLAGRLPTAFMRPFISSPVSSGLGDLGLIASVIVDLGVRGMNCDRRFDGVEGTRDAWG